MTCAEFRRLSLQKFAPRRVIKEEIVDRDRSAGGAAASSTRKILPPVISIAVPEGSSPMRVVSSRREKEAIDGKASAAKPKVAIES